jgi:predicted Zn-dependent peptidase
VAQKMKIQKELVSFFFEHLFEGTENIKRGEWFKIVTGNGGTNNANTSDDRTYYYEVFI